MLAAHLNEDPATTIIIHYGPVEGTTKAIDRYEHLSNITRTVLEHNALLVIGNCNARLGLEDAPYTFYDKTKMGKLLPDYSLEANIIIANTRFQKNEGNFSLLCPKLIIVNLRLIIY